MLHCATDDVAGDNTEDCHHILSYQRKHTFPFLTRLPRDIPASYEGVVGGTSYLATVTVITDEDGTVSEECQAAFTVLGWMDSQ